MNKEVVRKSCAALALTMALVSASASASPSAPVVATFYDCEGDACSSVTLAFDDSRQQYRAQNNSADRWAKVTASNVASSASACLGPGESEYLPLKSYVAPYRAEFADTRCGTPQQPGYPPAGE